jgi:hypothetical protein
LVDLAGHSYIRKPGDYADYFVVTFTQVSKYAINVGTLFLPSLVSSGGYFSYDPLTRRVRWYYGSRDDVDVLVKKDGSLVIPGPAFFPDWRFVKTGTVFEWQRGSDGDAFKATDIERYREIASKDLERLVADAKETNRLAKESSEAASRAFWAGVAQGLVVAADAVAEANADQSPYQGGASPSPYGGTSGSSTSDATEETPAQGSSNRSASGSATPPTSASAAGNTSPTTFRTFCWAEGKQSVTTAGETAYSGVFELTAVITNVGAQQIDGANLMREVTDRFKAHVAASGQLSKVGFTHCNTDDIDAIASGRARPDLGAKRAKRIADNRRGKGTVVELNDFGG